MTNRFFHPLDNDIYLIDTGYFRPQFDACYLIKEKNKGAIIDCGTHHSIPFILESLSLAGLSPEDIDWLILTHIHLDHAGGAGLLIKSLPKAKVLVHPRGVRHMIDPTHLIQGAIRVYGEDVVEKDYGTILPIEADRVISSVDLMTVSLNDRILTLIDSPGHALHHHCLWDRKSEGWFTGDSFGISYPEFDSSEGRFIIPTTSPSQFDPVALHKTIRRLLDFNPKIIYPTHFGPFTDVAHMAKKMLLITDKMVNIALKIQDEPDRYSLMFSAFKSLYCQALEEHNWQGNPEIRDKILDFDLTLNCLGVESWLNFRHSQNNQSQ
jgi:glyoxylase-like metal-dependent hydrolase (beta-lactamase superfamily II)